MNDKLKILFNGIIAENPTFVLMLGMCPTLGTTGSAINGMSMGLATMAVLICSNVVISLIKTFVPSKVRIPAYIVVIAAFVSVLQLVMEAYVPSLYATLGFFIPLILVNCIVLGVAITVVHKGMNLGESIVYALATAVGFTMAIAIFAGIREQLAWTSVPKAMRGVPIAMICAGLLAMAFMGFSGIKIG